MAYKPDIQYITQFYVPGSEAPAVAPKQEPKKGSYKVPKYVKREQVRVIVDPVALVSFAVAIALLITMAVSMVRFTRACEDFEAMQAYVTELEAENIRLSQSYHGSIDLEKVYEQATAMGMIPVSEAQTIPVSVSIPVPEPEPTLWDDIIWFLEGLFA